MRPCHHGWRCARRMRLGGVDGQMAVHSGPSKRTFEAMQPDWMLRLTSGFLQSSALNSPDTPAPPARAQDGRKAPNGIRLCIITVWRIVGLSEMVRAAARLARRPSWDRLQNPVFPHVLGLRSSLDFFLGDSRHMASL